MHFRCPNCHQPVQIQGNAGTPDDHTMDGVTCPSCNSHFSLSENDASTMTLPAGRRVEHFELHEILGEGSFGTVYKAWDLELQRYVALKVPRSGIITAESSAQFLREARMVAQIEHPNVVSVYEIGKYEDSFYIASQLIDGVTLRERLKIRPFTEREAAELLIPLLRAIQVFHDQGIIHRDLKPGNVLISADGTPYVVDFGLARRESPGEVTVTHDGKVVGTILYMSPEQARGEIKQLTNRTDIFAMGVILFELLTGQRPFEAAGSRTVLYRITTEDAPSPRSLKKGLSRDLETICLKALRKVPADRYESAKEMAEDLQRFLDGKPIEARPVSIFERSWKLILRHRMVSAATAVSFIAVFVALWMFVRPMAGTVPATITAENGDAELHFVRYNDVLHVPHESGFQVHARSGQRVHLMPGLYLVKARDEEGRSHEVWRTVPELPSRALGDPRYPHRAWTIEEGTVVLQSFRLFADQDVAEPLVMIKGGEFEAGIEKDDGLMRRHRQTVADFEAGVNEVSYGAFRKVLNQTVKSNSLKGTYLDQVNSQYGDRSSIANEMPITGYPIDVAILYCELAGGRLPTSMEWEYLATLGGTAAYSTGDNPPVQKPDDWTIEALTAATADTTPSGVRHLCSSVAEYTDSRCLSYVLLYPEKFPENQRSRVSTEELARLPELIEVRGAPSDWIKSGVAKDTFNPRQRNIAPFPGADQEALTNYGRIGWRMVRAID